MDVLAFFVAILFYMAILNNYVIVEDVQGLQGSKAILHPCLPPNHLTNEGSEGVSMFRLSQTSSAFRSLAPWQSVRLCHLQRKTRFTMFLRNLNTAANWGLVSPPPSTPAHLTRRYDDELAPRSCIVKRSLKTDTIGDW